MDYVIFESSLKDGLVRNDPSHNFAEGLFTALEDLEPHQNEVSKHSIQEKEHVTLHCKL